jgi:uncharacterized membrane protein YGL010W
MSSLADQLDTYAAYHRDWRNKLTHFVGVPLVTFALFLFLGWLRFTHAPEVPFTGATLFYLVVLLYYLSLDWRVALLQTPFSLALLVLSDWVALWPFAQSLAVFAVAFVAGWAVQLLGHGFEGRRPALADNVLQIFNAPLFLTVEVLCRFGFRPDLRRVVEATTHPAPGGQARAAAAASVAEPNEPLQPTGPAGASETQGKPEAAGPVG